ALLIVRAGAEAVRLLDQTVERVRPHDPDLTLRLQAEALSITLTDRARAELRLVHDTPVIRQTPSAPVAPTKHDGGSLVGPRPGQARRGVAGRRVLRRLPFRAVGPAAGLVGDPSPGTRAAAVPRRARRPAGPPRAHPRRAVAGAAQPGGHP